MFPNSQTISRAVLFFGSQGAGKGTQAELLTRFLAKTTKAPVIRIDMGQELRTLRDTGTRAGNLTGEIIDNGIRIYDFVPIFVQTKKVFENFTGTEHIIADGLARGADQTRAFDDMMTFFGLNLQIINIVISDESSIKRLLARGRNDDAEEAVRRRLQWTKEYAMPQLELFKARGRHIHTIDGEPDIKTIHKNILSVLQLA